MSTSNPKVDTFIQRATAWEPEIRKLRTILLGCGLAEELKWGKPCYTFEGKNIALIQPFKGFCALMFFKGTLLEDTEGLLRTQGENSQAAMRLEFSSERAIRAAVIKAYVKQAVAIEERGEKVAFTAKDDLRLPSELQEILGKNRALAKAFASLTPGRRRGYVLHFAAAKQAATRIARIAKATPAILAGKGLHDQ